MKKDAEVNYRIKETSSGPVLHAVWADGELMAIGIEDRVDRAINPLAPHNIVAVRVGGQIWKEPEQLRLPEIPEELRCGHPKGYRRFPTAFADLVGRVNKE